MCVCVKWREDGPNLTSHTHTPITYNPLVSARGRAAGTVTDRCHCLHYRVSLQSQRVVKDLTPKMMLALMSPKTDKDAAEDKGWKRAGAAANVQPEADQGLPRRLKPSLSSPFRRTLIFLCPFRSLALCISLSLSLLNLFYLLSFGD